MNETSIYITTSRLILQADKEDTSSWADIYESVSSLRDSLSCTVCNHLVVQPYTPNDSDCQHHVCRACKGENRRLKSGCSSCKDYKKYSENAQLGTLLQCYKKMCSYVLSSKFYRALSAKIESNSANSESYKVLVEMLKEGANFEDDNNAIALPVEIGSVQSTSTQIVHPPHAPTVATHERKMKNSVQKPTSSIIASNNHNRRRGVLQNEAAPPSSPSRGVKKRKRSKTTEIKGERIRNRRESTKISVCSCDGKLRNNSCRGYYCPCYFTDTDCKNCSCVNCKNPKGVSSG